MFYREIKTTQVRRGLGSGLLSNKQESIQCEFVLLEETMYRIVETTAMK